MGLALNQIVKVGAYVVKQQLKGVKRYPLVLMLEPLFKCNLACSGCGKIDYPAEILNQRLSVAECLEAVDECGAPVVVIAGGEPLLHKEIDQVVQGIIARGELKNGVFMADEVLAKHDEKYMPPEVAKSLKHPPAADGSPDSAAPAATPAVEKSR